MTLEEWFDQYFAPEYLNVQDPAAFKEQAKQALQEVLAASTDS